MRKGKGRDWKPKMTYLQVRRHNTSDWFILRRWFASAIDASKSEELAYKSMQKWIANWDRSFEHEFRVVTY